MNIKKLCIVAGAGDLPYLAAEEALQKNINIVIFSISEEISRKTQATFNLQHMTETVSLGALGNLIKKMKKYEVSHALFLGKVRKEHLFNKKIRFDSLTLKLLKNLKDRKDDSVMHTIADELAKNQIIMIEQPVFLQNLFLRKGVHSKKKPSPSDKEDIIFGMYFARKMGELDIGQTVVVRHKSLLAIEAIEGTDLCIARGAKLAKGAGAVVCKAEKKGQDKRFDIPTIGLDTLRTMHDHGAHVLAFEADKTFIVTPNEVIHEANRLKLILVAV